MAATSGAVKYKPLSKYPSVTQDICLQIPESVSYGALSAEFEQSLKNHHAADQSYDTYPIDIYTSEQIKGQKRITYRVILTSSTHTLTDDVLSSLLEKVAADMNSKFSATRI